MVTSENFEEFALDEEKDVLLMLHAKSCESCAHFSVYFKRMANRFKELSISSLAIARMDVTNDSPPSHLNLMTGSLPILILLPAVRLDGIKPVPIFYSGLGKVQPMMKWVQKFASISFELPNLPHLNEEQVGMYKTQVPTLCDTSSSLSLFPLFSLLILCMYYRRCVREKKPWKKRN